MMLVLEAQIVDMEASFDLKVPKKHHPEKEPPNESEPLAGIYKSAKLIELVVKDEK